jgi:hypothetical protein
MVTQQPPPMYSFSTGEKPMSLHSNLIEIARARGPLAGIAERLAFTVNTGLIRPLTQGHLEKMADPELSGLLEHLATLPDDADLSAHLAKSYEW